MAVSEFEGSLRRLRRSRDLRRREARLLPFFRAAVAPPPGKILYDSTVYVDVLRGAFPGDLAYALKGAEIWHSAVAEAELAMFCGILDPRHAGTPAVVARVLTVVNSWAAHRLLSPDREVWREAGLLAGVLARTQGYAESDRRRALNDALIFVTARKHGLTVLTRNVADFDLLQQLDARGQVLFYEIASER